MATLCLEAQALPDVNAIAEHLRRARQWAWTVFDYRVPGVSRDLAWSLIALARDHDPETYSPWLNVEALEPAKLAQALGLATEIARLIRNADRLQPNPICDGGAGR